MSNLKTFLFTTLCLTALAITGLFRLEIDTDLMRSLPSGEKVIADGLDIFTAHPIHDQIAIDISIDNEGGSQQLLTEIGQKLEEKLSASQLFSQVGMEDSGDLFAELALYTSKNLPLLLSQEELQERVAPLLEKQAIHQRLQGIIEDLSTMDGIGKTAFLEVDPLDLKNIILEKLTPLAPTKGATFSNGSLFSADGKHLLVTAKPHQSGTNTASAKSISVLLDESFSDISNNYSDRDIQITFTPVGAYRAALDNERIIRHDVQFALLLATAGIGLLLFISFPRPLIGLLSLVPALAGVALALFTYSLFHSSISIMVLGFGGAVISITVDHGIAYLLFLDRNRQTKGKEASTEVRAIGILAVLTSIGAFLILSFSGFPVFEQLGQFTALGIFFSFLFVHSIFPRVFPTMSAGSSRKLHLHSFVGKLYGLGWPGSMAIITLGFILAFFAEPRFYTSLDSMNTVSKSTIAADKLISEVWGGLEQKTYLMSSENDIAALQTTNDLLLKKIENDVKADILQVGFTPSYLFPGDQRATENRKAWQNFWNEKRVEELQENLQQSCTKLGFSEDAFSPFFNTLKSGAHLKRQEIPDRFFDFLTISEDTKSNSYHQFITVIPGEKYDPNSFFQSYGEKVKIFNAQHFTDRLSTVLFSTFTRMLTILFISVFVLLFLFFLDLRLTFLALLPPVFAFVCTLGVLNIIDHPIDIPALMLSIVIFGMGIDYSLFCVRAHQRYREVSHPSYRLVLVAVFMAGGSTLIGFGVLCFAEHSLLKSIGITSLLGIGFSLLGTYILLPPLLKHHFSHGRETSGLKKGDIFAAVRHRYRSLEAYTRMFARFKLKSDPMFEDLTSLLPPPGSIKNILDIGCGYGVPACWFLERERDARVFGVDPDPERVRSAAIATGERGIIVEGWATDSFNQEEEPDLILLLDMLHYLDDDSLEKTIRNCRKSITARGMIVARYVIPPPQKTSFSWKVEDLRIRLSGHKGFYRSPSEMAGIVERCGFIVDKNDVTASNPELYWLICHPTSATGNGLDG